MIIKNNNYNKYFDDRGHFYEIPNITLEGIAQYSVSVSKKNVIRGLHYQYMPQMGKQVNVIRGAIIDCVVDLRVNSGTYGMHKKIVCDSTQNNSIYVPPGFAHGFLSLEDDTTILYFQTTDYNKEAEGAIDPFDNYLNIDWGIPKEECILSEKDMNAETFKSFTAKNLNWNIL